MSAFLKYVQLDSVEEFVENPSAYVKRVNIVEVVDQDGNPWESVPGPDPWDELVIVSGANFVAENVYEIGQVVTGKTAIFTGGNPETTTYRSRWQTRRTTSDDWVNSNWMNTTNGKNDHAYPILAPGQLKFHVAS